MKHYAVFDIETAALPDAGEYVEPVTAPSNYRDPEKIAAYVAEKTAEQLPRCGLDPDLCRIVAVGLWVDGQTEIRCAPTTTEADVLEWFWRETKEAMLIGFNVVGFDLQILTRRSQYLQVPYRFLTLGKYRHPNIIDLQLMLSFDGARPYRSLTFYCKRFGIHNAPDITGADIAEAVAINDWPTVERHCRLDVEKTVALAQRLGVLGTEPARGPRDVSRLLESEVF